MDALFGRAFFNILFELDTNAMKCMECVSCKLETKNLDPRTFLQGLTLMLMDWV